MTVAENWQKDYWKPLGTVPSQQFDQYLSALETTLEERLEEIPDHDYHSLETFGTGYTDGNQDPHALERAFYSNLLDGLDQVETKTDLFRYSRDEIENPGPALPGPLDGFFDILGAPFPNRREILVQEIFEEAKEELNERAG